MFLLASSVFAITSNPAGIAPTSGDSEGASFTNFSVMGEDFAGAISSADLRGGVGMAASAFAPLLPETSSTVASLDAVVLSTVAYPSPFNPANESVTIAYQHSQDETVNVYLIDVAGQVVEQIRTNSATTRAADGFSRVTWDGSNAPTGVYLVQVAANGKIIARTKVILLRN